MLIIRTVGSAGLGTRCIVWMGKGRYQMGEGRCRPVRGSSAREGWGAAPEAGEKRGNTSWWGGDGRITDRSRTGERDKLVERLRTWVGKGPQILLQVASVRKKKDGPGA